jgi:hypothetical protein
MKRSSRRVSTSRSIVCPMCEIGEARAFGSIGARCVFCGRAVDERILESLRQMASLPEAIGSHACACG